MPATDPPLATLRVTDETRERSKQRVEVLIEGQVVAQLPATRVGYEMSAGDVSVLTVSVPAEGAAMDSLPFRQTPQAQLMANALADLVSGQVRGRIGHQGPQTDRVVRY